MAGVRIRYEQIIVFGLALAVAIGLTAFFKRTRLGTAMQGVVDDPALLGLQGISPVRVRAVGLDHRLLLRRRIGRAARPHAEPRRHAAHPPRGPGLRRRRHRAVLEPAAHLRRRAGDRRRAGGPQVRGQPRRARRPLQPADPATPPVEPPVHRAVRGPRGRAPLVDGRAGDGRGAPRTAPAPAAATRVALRARGGRCPPPPRAAAREPEPPADLHVGSGLRGDLRLAPPAGAHVRTGVALPDGLRRGRRRRLRAAAGRRGPVRGRRAPGRG